MIRIGTRGSKLALWQADYVAGRLNAKGIATEIVAIETKGDKIQNASFSGIGTKGLFTEELEDKLRTGIIDIAVHSAKDMQSSLPEGLELIAFSIREDPCDVLVSFDKTFSLERPGVKVVGTSSTRRRSIIQHYYSEVRLQEARGNLQTRFQKMRDGQFEAMILAYAGVNRMELNEFIVQKLPLPVFTPAVGQGAITIEASVELAKEKKEQIRALVNHTETEVCLKAERAYLKKMEGGCSIPSFCLANIVHGMLEVNGGIISLDGKEEVRKNIQGSIQNPEEAGLALANLVLGAGGDKILESIKKVRD